MELSFAFLAKFAETAKGMMFNASGADFDTVRVPSVPAVALLYLVAKFIDEHDTRNDPHILTIWLSGPNEHRECLADSLKFPDRPALSNREKKPAMTLVIQMSLPFPANGKYLFDISLDGQVIKTIPLFVEVGTDSVGK